MGKGKLTGHHANPGPWIQSPPKRRLDSSPPSLQQAGYMHSRTAGITQKSAVHTYKARLPLSASSMLCTYKEVEKPKDWKERLRACELLLTLPSSTAIQLEILWILLFCTYVFSSASFPWILHSHFTPKGEHKIFTWPRAGKILAALKEELAVAQHTHPP